MQRRYTVVGMVAFMATAAIPLSMKEWSATIRPQDGSTISGTATAMPREGDSMLVNISIKGAKAGETLTWHVHQGGCDKSGAVIGDASRYKPISVAPTSGTSMTAVKSP